MGLHGNQGSRMLPRPGYDSLLGYVRKLSVTCGYVMAVLGTPVFFTTYNWLVPT